MHAELKKSTAGVPADLSTLLGVSESADEPMPTRRRQASHISGWEERLEQPTIRALSPSLTDAFFRVHSLLIPRPELLRNLSYEKYHNSERGRMYCYKNVMSLFCLDSVRS
ncbi:hypothetical protein AVEN_63360-1 [Araneus ventricosus]|uniref:Uncharacterized protein n=1 Tax=Araneus ventricosus TaxID=182803 RepID=A0A4Y2CJC3_ARAVE|nr:hypothetical protein AVEN_63360-1 [Araneus ventricosus]